MRSAWSADGNCRRLAEAPTPGAVGVGSCGRGSESGSACESRPQWGWGRVRGARRLGVSAPFSHAAGARARGHATGEGGAWGGARGGCWSSGSPVYAPWVVFPPACGMGNEAFLRSNSITSFSSQEPGAATATIRHESGFLPWRVAEPSSPSPHRTWAHPRPASPAPPRRRPLCRELRGPRKARVSSR